MERLELILKEYTNGYTVMVDRNCVYLVQEVAENRLEALRSLKLFLDKEIAAEEEKQRPN